MGYEFVSMNFEEPYLTCLLWIQIWIFMNTRIWIYIDPTDLGVTIVFAQTLCLTIFNLCPTQKTCLFIDDNGISLVCMCIDTYRY